MSFTRSGINFSKLFLALVDFASTQLRKQKHKIHDYTDAEYGKEYIFESSGNNTQGYMTARGKGVKVGDYIILRNGSTSYHYQVKEIDYYSNPADMWMALLQKATNNSF